MCVIVRLPCSMAVNYYGNPNGSATGMQSLIAASYSYVCGCERVRAVDRAVCCVRAC